MEGADIMLKRYAICHNCRHWREGAPSDMRLPVVHDEAAEVGICEIGPASMYEMDGAWVAFQPEVHATRSCADFSPPRPAPYDGDDDPGGGEPAPGPGRVHPLFSVHPIPQAA